MGLTLGIQQPTASAASATTLSRPVITMFSDPSDYIGGGTSHEFDPSNSTISGSASATGISLSASGGTTSSNFGFDITPPAGTKFAVGYYPNVQRAEFATAGHPGMDISGDGRGCNQDGGWFEVRDLAVANGAITRLDLLYEQHCEMGVPALFGQIQIGEPMPARPVLVSSSSITWPTVGIGGSTTPAPIYLRNLGTTSAVVGKLVVGGTDARMFGVSGDQCSNQTLTPGGACLLFVNFTPSTRGPHSATLSVPVGSARARVQLDGLTMPGTTGLTMSSQPGDYIGQGGTYKFTSGPDQIGVSGSASGFHLSVGAADGEWWGVDLVPGSGRVLTPGFFDHATRYPFNGNGNGLSVDGDGRGCNTLTGSFTVKQAVYSAVDNSLQHFDATFIQHCEGATPALTGEVKFDYAPVVTAPPNVTNLTGTPSGHNVILRWTNPTVAQWRYTIVRVQPATTVAVAPFTGTAVYSGSGTTATVSGLVTGAKYLVTVFTVDRYGNVSGAQALKFTAP